MCPPEKLQKSLIAQLESRCLDRYSFLPKRVLPHLPQVPPRLDPSEMFCRSQRRKPRPPQRRRPPMQRLCRPSQRRKLSPQPGSQPTDERTLKKRAATRHAQRMNEAAAGPIATGDTVATTATGTIAGDRRSLVPTQPKSRLWSACTHTSQNAILIIDR